MNEFSKPDENIYKNLRRPQIEKLPDVELKFLPPIVLQEYREEPAMTYNGIHLMQTEVMTIEGKTFQLNLIVWLIKDSTSSNLVNDLSIINKFKANFSSDNDLTIWKSFAQIYSERITSKNKMPFHKDYPAYLEIMKQIKELYARDPKFTSTISYMVIDTPFVKMISNMFFNTIKKAININLFAIANRQELDYYLPAALEFDMLTYLENHDIIFNVISNIAGIMPDLPNLSQEP